jgi:outer membrane protein assembly factor BamB
MGESGERKLGAPLNHDSDRPVHLSSAHPASSQTNKPKRKAGGTQAAVGVRRPAEPSPEPPPDASQAGNLVVGARSGSLSCLDSVTGEQRWNTHAHDG